MIRFHEWYEVREGIFSKPDPYGKMPRVSIEDIPEPGIMNTLRSFGKMFGLGGSGGSSGPEMRSGSSGATPKTVVIGGQKFVTAEYDRQTGMLRGSNGKVFRPKKRLRRGDQGERDGVYYVIV